MIREVSLCGGQTPEIQLYKRYQKWNRLRRIISVHLKLQEGAAVPGVSSTAKKEHSTG